MFFPQKIQNIESDSRVIVILKVKAEYKLILLILKKQIHQNSRYKEVISTSGSS